MVDFDYKSTMSSKWGWWTFG